MSKKLVRFILILQLVCVTPRALGSQAADDLRVKLAKCVTNYNLGALNFPEALIRVSADFKVPMGIVWVDTPATNAELPFAWKDSTSVQGIIESIAKRYPGYQFQVRNGVAHVSPSSAIPDRQSFLKLKVSAFQTHNAMIEVASFKLHMLVTPIRGNQQISIAGPGDSEVTVDLKNSTVEDVLDTLVVASNRDWIVTFTDDNRLTSRGFRRTRSLFTNAPIPDQDEPVWHLQRWEDPMPRVVSVAK